MNIGIINHVGYGRNRENFLRGVIKALIIIGFLSLDGLKGFRREILKLLEVRGDET